jgi:sugar phosphate permease
MTILMIAASLLAGRWTVVAGLRLSVTIGCLLLAVGLFLTPSYLSMHPSYVPLIVALALAGIGIGTTVVPITSAVLSTVPAERSGMAASATNTSREIGAVTGVAILGSLMFSRLHVSLVQQMDHLHVAPIYQGLVINAIETGNFSVPPGLGPELRKLQTELTHVAYGAFHSGLRAALYLSAVLALVAAVLALVTLRSRPADAAS